MNLLNAAKQARDANESLINDDDSDIDYDFDEKLRGIRKATEALRAAIKQAEEAEPVAWMWKDEWGYSTIQSIRGSDDAIPLYTRPSFAAPQEEQKAVGDSGLTGGFPVGAAPEGWKLVPLVPLVPTEAMLEHIPMFYGDGKVKAYDSMLNAAPEAPK